MLIGSRQMLKTFHGLPSFTIDSNSIKQVEFTKSLGVYIDENLTWNVHIEHIYKKIASCIGILKRSRSFVPFETLLCIFRRVPIVATLVTFGISSLWGSLLSGNKNRLQIELARPFFPK